MLRATCDKDEGTCGGAPKSIEAVARGKEEHPGTLPPGVRRSASPRNWKYHTRMAFTAVATSVPSTAAAVVFKCFMAMPVA
jgi:hypothetical protein